MQNRIVRIFIGSIFYGFLYVIADGMGVERWDAFVLISLTTIVTFCVVALFALIDQ